ncbi:MAG TPA: hypothetical protein VHS03_08695, partial [Gaiellaceae bacterium]|nr:hypothetical protein [Gaiellaceae bacterium]
MPGTVVVAAVTTADRWLATFSFVAVAIVAVGALLRRSAQGDHRRTRQPEGRRGHRTTRSVRRRGGVVLALGPLVGLAFAPARDDLVVIMAVGAAVLALLGALTERRKHAG